jgi:hypothetical protein
VFGKSVVAIDGTKTKASNNKKNYVTVKKTIQMIAHHTDRFEECLAALDDVDADSKLKGIIEGMTKAINGIELYLHYQQILDENNSNALSLVDPDARMMKNGTDGYEIAYNVQAAVDGKENFVAGFDISQNPADTDQLFNMMEKVSDLFGITGTVGLADRGYHNDTELEKCEQASYNVVVPRQAKTGDKSRNKAFRFDKFIYDTDSDTYTCPLGKTLSSTSAATTVTRKYTNKQACVDCPSKDLCLAKKQEFKVIRRTKADDIYDRTERICKQSKELYRERQQIVEPVFGSIKQTQNGRYFLLRTKEKVRCEAGLLFLGYNIKRSVSSLGFDCLMALLDYYGAKTVNRSSNTAFLLLISPCIQVISRNNKLSKTFMGKVRVRGGCKASAA